MRACNQLGSFLTHRETNLRYLALESMCLLATSEFSHEAVKKHQETVINALKVWLLGSCGSCFPFVDFLCPCDRVWSSFRPRGTWAWDNVRWIFSTLCATRATPKRLYKRCWRIWSLPITRSAKKWFVTHVLTAYRLDHGYYENRFPSPFFCDSLDPHFQFQLCSPLFGWIQKYEMRGQGQDLVG